MSEFTLRGSLPAGPLKLRVKELREARGLTRADLAARAGCDRMTIARLERGAGRPNAKDLERLASALGVTPEELVEEAPAP
jgi:transcriptional regulator with XRE-family HTH domain